MMEGYMSDGSSSENDSGSNMLDFSYLMLDSPTLSLNLDSTGSEQAEKVESLLLYHNQLSGLPDNIAMFRNLRLLDVSANHLTTLPESIAMCQHLTSLVARSNNLEDDSFPKSFASLTSLRELNLSGNSLTVVPPCVFQLTELRFLYIGSNRIVEVGKDIGHMNKLQVLYLGGNNLSHIPWEIGLLKELRALVLCENVLESLPSSIANMTQLKSLLLHKNGLTTLPPEIVTLQNLMELSLRDNPLVVRFVRDMTYDPPSLLELAARTIKVKNVLHDPKELPTNLREYLGCALSCVNPKCKGVYFDNRVEHIKFVDFCGKYRIPLLQYLCSPQCSSRPIEPDSDTSDSESDEKLKKVLLG